MKRPLIAPPLRQVGGSYSPASQTLVRGLDVLEEVASGPLALPQLATRLGLARSTTHRLATALLERRYLTLVPRQGYGLGPKLLELGSSAQEQIALIRVARPYLDRLAEESLDTALLAIAAGRFSLVLERVAGRRRLLPALRPGETLPLAGSAAGCALLFDAGESGWRELEEDGEAGSGFAARMARYRAQGFAADETETEDGLRGVAAPVRGFDGAVVAALSVTGAAQFWTEARQAAIGRSVAAAAAALSRDLGHPPAGDAVNGGGAADKAGVAPEAGESEAKAGAGEKKSLAGRRHAGLGDAKAAPAQQSHLEAEPLSVHDPLNLDFARADKSDKGVSDAQQSRAGRRGKRHPAKEKRV